MKYLNTYIAFILVMSLFSCKGQQSSDVADSPKTEVSTQTGALNSQPISVLNELNLAEIVLIDVRTPDEFNAGHVQEALNINYFDENFSDQINDLNTDKTLYLYCRSGNRSMKAAKLLSAKGYSVVNLEGGYSVYAQ